MFFHNFKYEFLTSLRQKEIVIWVIIFPIVLGSFFKAAFSGITESTKFSQIPIAVVSFQENEMFKTVMSGLSEGDDALFDASFCDESQALELLEEKKVDGIIYSDDLTMTVSSSGIEQTIIKSFLEQYRANVNLITEISSTNPEKIMDVVEKMNSEINANKEIALTEGEWDEMTSYYYNLIAMTALFGSFIGVNVALRNQANLSQLGARKNCSPAKKSVSLTAGLASGFALHTLCMSICVTFLHFILGINFGDRLILVYFAAIVSGTVGISLGFFVGALGRMGEGAKIGILTGVSLLLCFCSGLMVGNMKAFFASHLPWFNEINPAAVISDAFYCLSIYSDYDRFFTKIITMLITSVIFTCLGFFATRKRKFNSL